MSPRICKFKRRQFLWFGNNSLNHWEKTDNSSHHCGCYGYRWLNPHFVPFCSTLNFIPFPPCAHFTTFHFKEWPNTVPLHHPSLAGHIFSGAASLWGSHGIVSSHKPPTEHSASASASHYYWLVKLFLTLMVIVYLDHYFWFLTMISL